jgi:hypothetical protein
MEASKLELTEKILRKELIDWLNEFKSGRNQDDLRFGQYIWCKYEMKKLFPVSDGAIDGFTAESPSEAFVQIQTPLLKLEQNG